MELVAGRLVERTTPVRADLGPDLRISQQAEGTARRRPAGEVEMQRPLASSSEMEAARRVEERRQLGQPVALPSGRDPRELLSDVLGGHSSTPSSASRRRLTPTPAEP